jgi:hypothetical protein
MEREEIIKLLKENHESFSAFINGLTKEEFLFTAQQKWTAGQQLQHIYLSVRPVALALHLPKILIRIIFGKANRPGRTYDELVKRYLLKLENGGRATAAFIPKAVAFDQREKISEQLNGKINALCSGIKKFTEQELDTMILPHPLLGKLTIREMLYFTIYHVEHHQEITKRNLHLFK